MSDRFPPSNIAAEEALIGACLLSRDALANAREIVQPEDFYKPQHRTMFGAMLILADAEETIDPITVADAFTGGDRTEAIKSLSAYQNMVPSISGAARYAGQILHAAQLRSLIYVGSDLVDIGYEGTEAPGEVAESFSKMLADHELLRRHQGGNVVGYYPDIGLLDTGDERDDAQPWIGRGVLRRGQRMLIVARAGIGKSTLLRQLAFCAVNGVHPLIGQPIERKRRALIVELEAGAWDITSSTRDLLIAIKRIVDAPTMAHVERPALLHRPGGLDLRTAAGLAALELSIQRSQPELVVMGPIKYLFSTKPGENYEMAALAVHGILNTLMAKYRFALAMEAHFSRGDHGAPGGSERWVDWPDVGFAVHPPEDCPVPPPPGTEMVVKQFRNPRDGGIFIPPFIMRGARGLLPWYVNDQLDPNHSGRSIWVQRYGGSADYTLHSQTSLDEPF